MAGITRDTVVDERYRIERRVGSGGMADVYQAEDLQLGRQVALKLLYQRFAEDGEFVERFRREASAAARLQHPNVVGVFDRGEWDGTSYIAMELIEGRSLKQIIRDQGPLEPERAIDLVIQVLRALRYAHRHGIVHRDIKPQNVLVDDEDVAKVTDFGIARAGASDMTETGSILGTAQYLSPEQAQGHAITPRTDLYSTGIVLYECLTGRVPFDGDSAVSVALRQVTEAPLPPGRLNARLSPALEGVVLRAMAKDPARRFVDADEFIAALEDARDGGDPGPRLDTDGYPVIDPAALEVLEEDDARNRRWLLWVGLALAVLALCVGAYLLLRPDQVTVPNVVNQTSSVAATRLGNEGFEVDIETVRNADVPRDRVATQRPSPGERADEGSTVALIVSSGPGDATVPAVVGLTQRSATRRLADAGFAVDAREQASDDVEAGRVISAAPPEGSQATVGGTVTLAVSSGPTQVDVPDVVGEDADAASSQLEAAGLRFSLQEQTSDQAPNTVLSQNPAAGSEAAQGSTVALTVAQAPAEVQVPEVEGLPVADAVDAVDEAGLRTRQRAQTVDTPDEDGIVVSQNPPGGDQVAPDARVTLVVGEYTPPDPDPTPEP